jgi:hypothetical protein
MGDMLRVQLATKDEHDGPVWDTLSASACGIRATVHGTTGFTAGQLVFNRDVIFRTHVAASIELVQQRRRQAAVIQNNLRENQKTHCT